MHLCFLNQTLHYIVMCISTPEAFNKKCGKKDTLAVCVYLCLLCLSTDLYTFIIVSNSELYSRVFICT